MAADQQNNRHTERLLRLPPEPLTNISDEETPLLAVEPTLEDDDLYDNNNRRCMQRLGTKRLLLYLGIGVVVLFLVNLVYVIKYGVTVLQESVILDVPEISRLQLAPNGVKFDSDLGIKFDYNMAGSWYHRLVGKTMGSIGVVEIHANDEIEVFGNLNEKIDRPLRLLKLDLTKQKSLEVDLSQGEVSRLHIKDAIMELNAEGLSSFINSLSSIGETKNNVNFKVKVYNSEVRHKWLKLRFKQLTLAQSVDIDSSVLRDIFMDQVKLKDTMVMAVSGDGDSKYEYKILSNICLPRYPQLPQFSMDFTTLWNMSILDCNQSKVNLFELEINPFKIEQLSHNETTISIPTVVYVPKIDDSLTIDCKDGKDIQMSPINKFVTNLLNETVDVELFCSGSHTSDDTDGPSWIHRLITGIDIPINVSSSMVSIPSIGNDSVVKEITLNSVSLEIDDHGLPLVSSKMDVYFDLPIFIKNITEINITEVKGVLSIVDDNNSVATLELPNWQGSHFNSDNVCFSLNAKKSLMHIFDPSSIARIVNDVINNSENVTSIKFETSADLDLKIESDLVHSTFHSIRKDHLNVELPVDGALGSVFENITARLDNMIIMDSSESSISLLIDLEVLNPFSIDLTSGAAMSFDMWYNSSMLGRMQLSPVSGMGNEFINATGLLFVKVDTPQGKVQFEEMMGRYISGNRPYVTLSGHDNTIPNCPSLSKVLSELSLRFTLPQLEPPAAISSMKADAEYSGEESETKSSAFLLKSTMHLMSSQIELTVFNPISNHEIFVEIIEAKAEYEGTTLAYISKGEKLVILPGVYTTPKIPVTYSTNGMGGELLRKYLNGDLEIDASAILKIRLGELEIEILYQGSGLTADIRL